ncbi:MAG: hypothetical protein KAY22_08005 [Rhizorhabdus sp.]|uniref:single-stranded DNA-binding protein n=1 Tax=Rhizorhabdus sp. TaxID=1968843 RepID=UPI001B538320|nr:single-stranded DNA-binding protein [Rhizorhabdus sp.]MBP8232231.1 hypothetical protein [Rhizorhabdus sp.]
MAGNPEKETQSFLAAKGTGWVQFVPYYNDKNSPFLDFVIKIVEGVEKHDGGSADYTSMVRVNVFGDQAKRFADLKVGEAVTATGRMFTQIRTTRDGDQKVNLQDEHGKPVFEHVISIDDKNGELAEANLGAMPAARGRSGDREPASRGGRGDRDAGGTKEPAGGGRGGGSGGSGRGRGGRDAGSEQQRAAGGRGRR